jgi:hypothetical protein
MSIKKIAAITCLLLSAISSNASASFYNPFGIQHNVALSTITGGGWTQCYSSAMGVAIGNSAENVLSKCSGANLMMAGRQTGSDTFMLLAETSFAAATFNTGTSTQNVHASNGANWYFAPNWSWGFSDIGSAVNLNSCDVASGNNKMCLHTLSSVGGYRIGSTAGLNSSTQYEKVFFVSNGNQVDVPEPATISLLGLGLLGFAAARRRKQ